MNKMTKSIAIRAISVAISILCLMAYLFFYSSSPEAKTFGSETSGLPMTSEVTTASASTDIEIPAPQETIAENPAILAQEASQELGMESLGNADSPIETTTPIDSTENTSEEVPQQQTESVSAVPEKTESSSTTVRIGLIADSHAGQSNGFTRHNQMAAALTNADPDIVVSLGDFIDNRKNYKKITKSEGIADFKKASAAISKSFPFYHTIGNHEVYSLSKNDLKSMMGQNNYYSFKIKEYNVIVLDANYTNSGETIDVKHVEKLVYTGTLNEDQLGWLKNQLKKNKRNIIFIHHPINNLTNTAAVEEIIKDNNDRIIMIANGHKHPEKMGVSRFGGVKNYNMPSSYFERSYAIVTINEKKEVVTIKKY